MMQLLQSELFRLRKRAQSWILIAIAFLLTALFYGGFVIGSTVTSGTESEDLKEGLPFGELSDFGLSIGLGFFGSVMLVIIAAGMMGNEYGWNTLRPLVARARSRTSLITAKFLALLIYTVVFTVILTVLIALVSIVSSAVAGIDAGFSGDALVDALTFSAKTILVNLPYLAFAFMLATMARSNAAGIAGALGLSFIEPTIFGLLRAMNDRFDDIQKGGLSYNTEQVLFNSLADHPGSAAVLLLYTALFAGITYTIFLRRDVTSG
jgi:ABC-2 type transport system permease protein